jgi:FkbM family methyltransferase
VWQRVARRPVTVALPGGLRLRCHPHSTAASSVLYTRLPEWEHMRFVRDALRAGDVVVDVGANVGVYSLLAAGRADVEVWAYEPSSLAFDRLVENVELNRLGGRIHVRHAAVGAEAGVGRLTLGLDTTNRLVPDDGAPPGAVETVDVVRLDDDLPSLDGVTLLKIDVEGGELAVLDGAGKLLGASRPAVIVETSAPAMVGARLESVGYQPCTYDPASRSLRVAPDWDGAVQGRNLLAVADVDGVRSRLESTP